MIDALDQTKGIDYLNRPLGHHQRQAEGDGGDREGIPFLSTEFEENKNLKPVATKTDAAQTVIKKPPEFTSHCVCHSIPGVTLKRCQLGKDGTIELNLVPVMTSFIGYMSEKDGVKNLSANGRRHLILSLSSGFRHFHRSDHQWSCTRGRDCPAGGRAH